MNQTNTVMLAIFIALGAMMAVGLISVPGPADAKITPAGNGFPATNPAGNEPPGQQNK